MSDRTSTNRQTLDWMIRRHGAGNVQVRATGGTLGGHDVFVNGKWAAWMWAIDPPHEYRGDAWEDTLRYPQGARPAMRTQVRQWHTRRSFDEPECPPGKWRTRDRGLVVDIHQMDDDYLMNIERFTRGKRQHMQKRREVLGEMFNRGLQPQPALEMD
jgi:hypothetical protein